MMMTDINEPTGFKGGCIFWYGHEKDALTEANYIFHLSSVRSFPYTHYSDAAEISVEPATNVHLVSSRP